MLRTGPSPEITPEYTPNGLPKSPRLILAESYNAGYDLLAAFVAPWLEMRRLGALPKDFTSEQRRWMAGYDLVRHTRNRAIGADMPMNVSALDCTFETEYFRKDGSSYTMQERAVVDPIIKVVEYHRRNLQPILNGRRVPNPGLDRLARVLGGHSIGYYRSHFRTGWSPRFDQRVDAEAWIRGLDPWRDAGSNEANYANAHWDLWQERKELYTFSASRP